MRDYMLAASKMSAELHRTMKGRRSIVMDMDSSILRRPRLHADWGGSRTGSLLSARSLGSTCRDRHQQSAATTSTEWRAPRGTDRFDCMLLLTERPSDEICKWQVE